MEFLYIIQTTHLNWFNLIELWKLDEKIVVRA